MRKLENVVIGSTVQAVRYAKQNNYHLLLTIPHKYFFFDSNLEPQRRENITSLYIVGMVLNHEPVHEVSVSDSVITYFNG